jgi:hypothetical protein
MTTTITKHTQLSAEIASDRVDSAIALVREAKTFHELRDLHDQAKVLDALLRTRRAAQDIGDDIDTLRARARELYLECDLKQGQMARDLTPAEKPAVCEALGITKQHLSVCEKASLVPRQTSNVVQAVQRRKAEGVTVRDIAPLAPLTTPERRAVVAKLGDVLSVREAIEKAVVIPAAPAPKSAPKSAPTNVVVDTSAARFAQRARELRTAVNTLVMIAERCASTGKHKRERDAALATVETALLAVQGADVTPKAGRAA